jgi:ribonuclease BN (tRNA processing enzyme)
VVVSHLHADHCSDVASLIDYRRFNLWPPENPSVQKTAVLAPPGASDRFSALYAASTADLLNIDLGDVLDIRGLSDGMTVRIADCEVTARMLDHPGGSYGIRISDGDRSLAYSGDTGPTDRLVELAQDVDLFLCEASWPHSTLNQNPYRMHLSGKQGGEYAAAAGARRLVITHVLPWYRDDSEQIFSEAREAFGGPVELARAGSTLTI